MGKTNICDTRTKKDDESRWICFFKTLVWPFIITILSWYCGIVIMYYINNTANFKSIFSTKDTDYFTKPGFFDKEQKGQPGQQGQQGQQGGQDGFKCNAPKNKNIDLGKYASFPYFLPDKNSEHTFVNWFAHTIFKTTTFYNSFYSGFFKWISGHRDSSLYNLSLLFGGGIVVNFILMFFTFFSSGLVVLYYYFTTMNPYLYSSFWSLGGLGACISFLLGYPILLAIICIIYYPLKLCFLFLNPLIDDPNMIIDIIKCYITPIAYALTLIMVVNGWYHLSANVASIMNLMWCGMLVKDIYASLNIII